MSGLVADLGSKLKEQTCGCRLSVSAPLFMRKMRPEHVDQVANLFKAQPKSLKASRAVINRTHERIAPILTVQAETKLFIKGRTVDYPEQGLRLVRVDRIEKLQEGFSKRKQRLSELLGELDAHWDEVKAEARERLKELYDEADYPHTPSHMFAMSLSFPEIAPDSRLQKLNPKLYEQMQAQIAARFEQAIQVAEAQAVEHVNGLLKHLVERMKPGDDGKAKILRSSSVDKLHEFLAAFKETTVGSNEDVDSLVARVEQIAGGVSAEDIRKSDPAQRAELQKQLDSLIQDADKLLEAMPTREFSFEDE